MSREDSIEVFVDMKKGVTAVLDSKNPKHQAVRGFEDVDGVGDRFNVFDKNEKNYLIDEIIFKHVPNYRDMTPAQRNYWYNRIAQNVDVSIYRTLEEYDCQNYWNTRKSDEYITAMIAPVSARAGESDSHLHAREMSARKNALEQAGISITYRTSGLLKSRTRLIDRFRIMKMIKNSEGLVSVENVARYKSQHLGKSQRSGKSKQSRIVEHLNRNISGVKKFAGKVVKSFTYQPKHLQKHYTAKPGVRQWMREKTQDSPEKT